MSAPEPLWCTRTGEICHLFVKSSVFRLTFVTLVRSIDYSRYRCRRTRLRMFKKYVCVRSVPSGSYLKDGAERVLVGVVDVERSLVVLHGRAHVSEAVAVELFVLINERRHHAGRKTEETAIGRDIHPWLPAAIQQRHVGRVRANSSFSVTRRTGGWAANTLRKPCIEGTRGSCRQKGNCGGREMWRWASKAMAKAQKVFKNVNVRHTYLSQHKATYCEQSLVCVRAYVCSAESRRDKQKRQRKRHREAVKQV